MGKLLRAKRNIMRPNNSFKPRPLRGSACVLACSTPPFRKAVRLNSGVRPHRQENRRLKRSNNVEDEVCGARSSCLASVLGQFVRSSAPLASFPPNKSFKPTPCRGVGHVLYATLAHVRRPATGRLNSGVRR